MHFDPWTLGLQAANFLVLVWLLQRFLYRPVLAIVAARQAAADKLTADARAAKTEAEALRQGLEQDRGDIAKARDASLKAAREAAEADAKAVLAKAHADAEAIRSEAHRGAERDRAAMTEAGGRDAARLAVAIVRRLLREAPARSVQHALLDLIGEDVAALPADAKAHIVERIAAPEERPQVITATPLDPDAAARLSDTLAQGLGAPADPVFRVDPDLLAGVEVHFPFTILRRSWSEDLKRIETELSHDDHAQVA